jgi:hypothetical protein
MRGALKYGVPAAAGLATGGYALSQGEDPGSAGLAAGLGALGAYGGLLGANLAGKYAKDITQRGLGKVEDLASQASARMPDNSKRANILMDISQGAGNVADQVSERQLSKVLAAGMVPASAAAAGLGGVALGAVPGAMGMPGFQQGIDPESYGSSNMPVARQSIPTLQYG